MPNVLTDAEIDSVTEEVDLVMTRAEEEAARKQFESTGIPQDLSDGGMVGGVMVTPMSAGKKLVKGRPAARRAWMWNGTESLLPLAWNPEGTRHDGARHYLLKRHCLCCHRGGFYGVRCPSCVKNNCERCKGSTDKAKIIPCFYLRKEDVPFPANFYGSIDCFLPFCIRRGDRGFKTEQEMRLHAMSRHRLEYQAHMETLRGQKQDEVEELKKRLDALMIAQMQTPQPQVSVITPRVQVASQTPAQLRMAHARAAKQGKKCKITKPAMA